VGTVEAYCGSKFLQIIAARSRREHRERRHLHEEICVGFEKRKRRLVH
jgi:hypothetical protein